MKKTVCTLAPLLLLFLITFSFAQQNPPTSGEYKKSGKLLDDSFLLDENISTSNLTFGQRFPKVAFDGNIYLVAWRDFRSQSFQNADVYASRVDQEGNPLDLCGLPICTVEKGQGLIDVVYDGTNFVVAWFDDREPGQTEIYFARVTSSGEVLDPDGIQATEGINMVSWNSPCLGTGNGITVIAWVEDMVTGSHAVKFIRIDSEANILDPDGFIVSDTMNDDAGDLAMDFDGTNFLIAWESGMYSLYDDLKGARISQAGDVLDPGGFTVAHKSEEQIAPDVCFGAGKFMVTWRDDYSGEADIYGTFISPEGTVADTNGFAISTAANQQDNPSIAFDGTNFIVGWTDRRFDWDVYATAVTPEGVVLDPEGWGVGAWENTNTMDCDIVTGTEHIFVVWEIDRFPTEEDIQGGRITIEDYSMIDWDGFDISLGPYSHANPDIAFDGTNYLAVWEDSRNGTAQVYGTRISAGGEVLDPDGIHIGSNDTMRVRLPSVCFNGTNFIVAWSFQRSNGYGGGGAMARVSTDGILLDDPSLTIPVQDDFSTNFSVCSDGNSALIAWNAWNNETSIDIFGVVAQTDGTMDLPFLICDAENYQEYPKLAFNGTNYLAVWEDSRISSRDIYGTLISPDGIILTPDGFEINDDQTGNNRPDAASNGNSFMVSWSYGSSSGESIYGTLLNADGSTSLSPFAIYQSTSFEYARHACIAYDGSNYLLSWENSTFSTQITDIMGASVDTLGTVNQQFTIDESTGNQVAPHMVAGNNGQSMAVFSGFTEEINGQLLLASRSYGIFIDQLIGVEEESAVEELGFEIFPNPAKNWFKVQSSRFKVGGATLELYDLGGRKLIEIQIPPGSEDFELDVSSLESGIYLCKISPQKYSTSRKIIIQK